jgi:large subunit ribosomal protein L31
MREGIHPNYIETSVTCACGNTFQTRSTKQNIRLEICSSCHPFFTGKQKFLDTAGRVERFQKRFAKTGGETVAKKPVTPKLAKGQKAALDKRKARVLSSAPVARSKPLSTSKAPTRAPGEKPAETKGTPTKAH